MQDETQLKHTEGQVCNVCGVSIEVTAGSHALTNRDFTKPLLVVWPADFPSSLLLSYDRPGVLYMKLLLLVDVTHILSNAYKWKNIFMF